MPPTPVERQRDFYVKLLDLTRHEQVETLLLEALDLAVDLSEARVGYVELQRVDGSRRTWSSTGAALGELPELQSRISSGILAQTMGSGQPLLTSSAGADPRFAALPSVQLFGSEAVACLPIGAPATGVVYLQGGGAVSAALEDIARLAHQLGALSERLLATRDREPTRPRSTGATSPPIA